MSFLLSQLTQNNIPTMSFVLYRYKFTFVNIYVFVASSKFRPLKQTVASEIHLISVWKSTIEFSTGFISCGLLS